MTVNSYPKLKFQKSIELDIEIGFQFMDMKAGGVDFGNRILELYPNLEKAKNESGATRREIIASFIKKYYSENKNVIEESLEQMKVYWESAEDDFFKGVKSIFGDVTWPQGDYICYLSVFDCNPRFLENKSFQVYYQHPHGTNHVIAHEMLHFLFFDYLKNTEAKLNTELDGHTVWLISEWFNDLVLELPQFGKFFQNMNTGYPEVVEFAKKFGKINKEVFNVQEFFKTIKAGRRRGH